MRHSKDMAMVAADRCAGRIIRTLGATPRAHTPQLVTTLLSSNYYFCGGGYPMQLTSSPHAVTINIKDAAPGVPSGPTVREDIYEIQYS